MADALCLQVQSVNLDAVGIAPESQFQYRMAILSYLEMLEIEVAIGFALGPES